MNDKVLFTTTDSIIGKTTVKTIGLVFAQYDPSGEGPTTIERINECFEKCKMDIAKQSKNNDFNAVVSLKISISHSLVYIYGTAIKVEDN